jgi:hypothetical protein
MAESPEMATDGMSEISPRDGRTQRRHRRLINHATGQTPLVPNLPKVGKKLKLKGTAIGSYGIKMSLMLPKLIADRFSDDREN